MDFEHLQKLKSFQEADVAVDRMLLNVGTVNAAVWGPRMMYVLRQTLTAVAYANVGKPPDRSCGREKALFLLSDQSSKKEVMDFIESEIPFGRRTRILQYFIDLHSSKPGLFEETVRPAVACL
jgi:hypothetical protein